MKRKTRKWAVVTTIVVLALAIPVITRLLERPKPAPPLPSIEIPKAPDRQDVWISALEWCESRGVPSAINPKDLDGTPSYGAFQFKPGTFSALAKAYGIKNSGIMDDVAQRAIVKRMINDPSMNLHMQFPDCINRKIGMPPPKVLS